MCGSYITANKSWEDIVAFSRLAVAAVPAEPLRPRYNIRPTQAAPILRHEEGSIEGALARWDLVPFWWKKPLEEKKFSTFNARLDKVAEAASYRTPVRKRRCLVPAQWFVEWRSEADGKQPWRIGLGTGEMFFMAGLWDRWSGEVRGETREILSFTVLTTEPNPLVARLHNRMPVILSPEDHEAWLTAPRDEALALAGIYPSQLMRAEPISRRINSSRNDEAGLVEPVGPALEAGDGEA